MRELQVALSFSGRPKPFSTYTVTPQRKIMDMFLFDFSSSFVPYNINHSGSRDPLFVLAFN